MEVPSYLEIVQGGEVLEKSNYHSSYNNCDCKVSQPLSQFRDLVVEYNGMRFIIFHSTPIVVKYGSTMKLSSGGWKTKSTKERINKHLPSEYKLVGTNDTRSTEPDWRIETPDEELKFVDGMEIDVS